MNLIVTALKQKLAPFGWTETLRRGGDAKAYAVSAVSAGLTCVLHPSPQTTSSSPPTWRFALPHHTTSLQAELEDIDSYLEKMGVKDARLRARLETQLPYTDPSSIAGSGARALQAVSPLNAAARDGGSASGSSSAAALPTLLVCCDAGGGLGGLEPLLAALDLPAFALCLPEGSSMEEAPADVPELAALAIKAARGVVPAGSRLVVAGVGFGGVLAHELSLQLSASSAEPPLALALLEGPHSLWSSAALLPWLPEERRHEVCQAGAALFPAVAAAAGVSAPSFEAFVSRLASLAGYDEQLDYVAGFKPEEVRSAGQLHMLLLVTMQSVGCSRLLPFTTLLCGRRARRPGTAASRSCCPAWPTGRHWLQPTQQPTSSRASRCCLLPHAEPSCRAVQSCSTAEAPPAPGAASPCWCSLLSFTRCPRQPAVVERLRRLRLLARCRPSCWRQRRRRQRRRAPHPRRAPPRWAAACC